MARPPLVNCSAGFDPSCATTQTSSSPVRSEMKATLDPSGDHCGHLSCALEELVRLRGAPFSIGAVKMSPRASNSARSPFGLSEKLEIRFEAFTRLGRRLRPSSGAVLESGGSFVGFGA